MLKKNYIKYLFLIPVMFGWASCSDFLDVNIDPNNPSDVPAETVLPVAQTSIGGVIGGDLAIVSGLWAQHWTQSNISSQYKTLDSYDITAKDYDIAWTEMFAGGLNDLEVIKRSAIEDENWNLYLQAVCIQTYGYQILADFFDQIPYSEALKGLEKLSPKFDEGPAIYDGLIAGLDEALSKDFDAFSNKHIANDLIFASNLDNQIRSWKQFANTLKLKILLRQTASPRAAAALASITALMNSGVEFLDQDGAITQFIDEPNRSNFLYENNIRQLNTPGNLRMSRTIHSFLEANGDLGRLNAYFAPGSTGQMSLVQGNFEAPTTQVPTGVISTIIFSPTDPFYFISEDESYFLQAEALLRMGQDAEPMYNAAVTQAYEKFGISVGGLLSGAYQYPSGGSFDDKLKAIMTQKWVAMFKQGWEAFFDQERTGYPKKSSVPATDPNYVPGELTYSVTGVTGGQFPKRLLFPSASKDVNVNTPTLVPVTTKVWWMPN